MIIRLMLLIPLLITNTLSLRGQESYFGQQLGLSITTINEDADQFDNKTGFTAGFATEIGLSSRISVQPGVSYIEKGGEINTSFGNFELNLNYLTLPLKLKYDILKTKKFRGYLTAGGFYGILTQAKTQVYDITSQINNEDYGALFGLGGEYEAGPGKVYLSVDYRLGIADVNQGKGKPEPPAPRTIKVNNISLEKATYKTRGLTINMGYAFGL